MNIILFVVVVFIGIGIAQSLSPDFSLFGTSIVGYPAFQNVGKLPYDANSNTSPFIGAALNGKDFGSNDAYENFRACQQLYGKRIFDWLVEDMGSGSLVQRPPEMPYKQGYPMDESDAWASAGKNAGYLREGPQRPIPNRFPYYSTPRLLLHRRSVNLFTPNLVKHYNKMEGVRPSNPSAYQW